MFNLTVWWTWMGRWSLRSGKKWGLPIYIRPPLLIFFTVFTKHCPLREWDDNKCIRFHLKYDRRRRRRKNNNTDHPQHYLVLLGWLKLRTRDDWVVCWLWSDSSRGLIWRKFHGFHKIFGNKYFLTRSD